jgi:hypothetical protein
MNEQRRCTDAGGKVEEVHLSEDEKEVDQSRTHPSVGERRDVRERHDSWVKLLGPPVSS